MAKYDPITGDELSRAEAVAWRVQWIIRRWTFLVGLTAVTAGAWTYVGVTAGWALRAGPLAVVTWWNVCASYLALLIESVVGMAMYHQVQRDAVILREIRQADQRIEALGEMVLEHLQNQEEDE